MKKIIIVSLVVVGVLLSASNVLAQSGPIDGCTLRHDITIDDVTRGPNQPDPYGPEVTSETPNWGGYCLLDTIHTITDWIFYGLLSLVSVLVVYGGFTLVTAGEKEDNVQKGRNLVLYATVGLIVAFLSRIIPSIAEGIVGA